MTSDWALVIDAWVCAILAWAQLIVAYVIVRRTYKQ